MPIQAAEWSMQPSIGFGIDYNDNYRLSTVDPDAVWSTSLRPALGFGIVTGNKGLTGRIGLSILRHISGATSDDRKRWDRENAYLNLNSFYRRERDNFGLNVNASRDSTLDTGEIDVSGEPGIIDPEVIDQDVTRLNLSIAPSWSRSVTEKTLLTMTFSHDVTRYSDELPPDDLIDYDYDVLSASLVRVLSPRMRGTLSGAYSRYRPETEQDSETLSLQIGVSGNLSETWSTSFLAGLRDTSFQRKALRQTGFCIGADPGSGFPACTGGIAVPTGITIFEDETENTGSVFNVSVSKTFETGNLTASLVRSASPSGTGELLDTTTLQLTGNRRLTEKINAQLTFSIQDRENITNTGFGATNNRKYLSISPAITWYWHRDLTISAHYRYRENESVQNTDNASGNVIGLTLNYRRPMISVSR